MLIRFEPSGVESLAREGDRVVDVCDVLPAHGVPFSCRAANCGTCRVIVIEGSASLEPPGADELRVLVGLGDDPREARLACQLVVGAGPCPRVVLRVVAR